MIHGPRFLLIPQFFYPYFHHEIVNIHNESLKKAYALTIVLFSVLQENHENFAYIPQQLSMAP